MIRAIRVICEICGLKIKDFQLRANSLDIGADQRQLEFPN